MNVVKLLPPLIAGQEEVDHFVEALDDVLVDADRNSALLFEFGKTLGQERLCAGSRLSADPGARDPGRRAAGRETGYSSQGRRVRRVLAHPGLAGAACRGRGAPPAACRPTRCLSGLEVERVRRTCVRLGWWPRPSRMPGGLPRGGHLPRSGPETRRILRSQRRREPQRRRGGDAAGSSGWSSPAPSAPSASRT